MDLQSLAPGPRQETGVTGEGGSAHPDDTLGEAFP